MRLAQAIEPAFQEPLSRMIIAHGAGRRFAPAPPLGRRTAGGSCCSLGTRSIPPLGACAPWTGRVGSKAKSPCRLEALPRIGFVSQKRFEDRPLPPTKSRAWPQSIWAFRLPEKSFVWRSRPMAATAAGDLAGDRDDGPVRRPRQNYLMYFRRRSWSVGALCWALSTARSPPPPSSCCRRCPAAARP